MSLIHEIQQQRLPVRMTMFVLATVLAVSAVGYAWYRSFEKDMYYALHQSTQERTAFDAKRAEQSLRPIAAVTKGIDSLTASIGSLIGLQRSAGIDRGVGDGHTPDAVYPLPLSR